MCSCARSLSHGRKMIMMMISNEWPDDDDDDDEVEVNVRWKLISACTSLRLLLASA